MLFCVLYNRVGTDCDTCPFSYQDTLAWGDRLARSDCDYCGTRYENRAVVIFILFIVLVAINS